MPDLGLNLAAFTLSGLGAQQALDVVRRGYEFGYRSCWTPEASGLEAFALLAACGAAAPGLDLGTAVVPIQVRSPLLAAMGASTLQALHPDRRIVLGVGISSPVVTARWHGVPYGDHAVARMREYLIILRQLLDGGRVDHDGSFYKLAGSRLGVRVGDRRPLLALAALGPAMLRLAGERADGVLLNYLPAGHVPACIDEVRRGESGSGREPGSCRIFACVHLGVTRRTDDTLERGRREIFPYALTDAYGSILRRAGFSDEVAALRDYDSRGDRKAALAAISDRLVDAINFVGSAVEARRYLAGYLDNGVDEAVINILPWGNDELQVIDDTLTGLVEVK